MVMGIHASKKVAWRHILIDTRDKFVLHCRTIAFPVFTIFEGTTFKVTATAMDENHDEKNTIEIGDDSCPADDRAPTKGHDPVGNVVLVARQRHSHR